MLQWGCTSTYRYSKYHGPTFHQPVLNPHILNSILVTSFFAPQHWLVFDWERVHTSQVHEYWVSVNCESRNTELGVPGLRDYMLLKRDRQQASIS
jgi:hypothetical protein